MYQIETNVPIPPRRAGVGRAPKYPFATMKVGESFLVKCEPKSIEQRRVVGAMRHSQRTLARKFASRYITEDSGVRVWRVE
jgi:hypothetical protein